MISFPTLSNLGGRDRTGETVYLVGRGPSLWDAPLPRDGILWGVGEAMYAVPDASVFEVFSLLGYSEGWLAHRRMLRPDCLCYLAYGVLHAAAPPADWVGGWRVVVDAEYRLADGWLPKAHDDNHLHVPWAPSNGIYGALMPALMLRPSRIALLGFDFSRYGVTGFPAEDRGAAWEDGALTETERGLKVALAWADTLGVEIVNASGRTCESVLPKVSLQAMPALTRSPAYVGALRDLMTLAPLASEGRCPTCQTLLWSGGPPQSSEWPLRCPGHNGWLYRDYRAMTAEALT